MDISTVNPSSHNDQEEFPVGENKFIHIPLVAKGQAITAASRKLQRGVEIYDGVTVSLPEAEATAIATAVVDPSQLRNDLERKRVSVHRTPSGYTLVSVEARVWTAAVSPDGANGRGRLEVKLAGGTVWPLPEETDATTSMRYLTRDIERMRDAVRDNSKRIVSADLRQSVREHPNGVWNPIYLVPASVVTEDDDGDVEACGFVHTAEGSTRVVTCLEGLGLEYDIALKSAGSQIDLVRRARAGVASRVSVQPRNDEVHHAIKVLTMPAHLVVGVLNETHQVSMRPFPQVVSEFVESIHEQPRPWTVLAQSGVRGERLVSELVTVGLLTRDWGNDIVGRDERHETTTPPNVIAGRLIRAASHSSGHAIVKKAILEDPARQNLTQKRYSQTVGALLLPVYQDDKRRKTMAPALTNDFQPPALRDDTWRVHEETDIPTLLERALESLDPENPAWSQHSRELVARGVTAVAALGLIYSDQGSAVSDIAWLRGSVAKVVNNLALCAGGLKTIAEAVEYLEARQDLPPLLYKADGEPQLDERGNEIRLVAEQGANRSLRELAFRDLKPESEGIESEDASAYDRFVSVQHQVASAVMALDGLVDRLYDMKDDEDNVLIDRYGLRRDVVLETPGKLMEARDRILLGMEVEVEPFEEDPDGEEEALRTIESVIDGIDPVEDNTGREDGYTEAA